MKYILDKNEIVYANNKLLMLFYDSKHFVAFKELELRNHRAVLTVGPELILPDCNC